ASVQGTRPQPYRTVAVLDREPARALEVRSSQCSCPVRHDCKHVVAVLIAVRDDAAASGDRKPAWEREIAALLESAEPSGDRPLALQFEVTSPRTASRFAAGGEMSGRLVKVR